MEPSQPASSAGGDHRENYLSMSNTLFDGEVGDVDRGSQDRADQTQTTAAFRIQKEDGGEVFPHRVERSGEGSARVSGFEEKAELGSGGVADEAEAGSGTKCKIEEEEGEEDDEEKVGSGSRVGLHAPAEEREVGLHWTVGEGGDEEGDASDSAAGATDGEEGQWGSEAGAAALASPLLDTPKSFRAVCSRCSNGNVYLCQVSDILLFLAMAGACVAYMSFLCGTLTRVLPFSERWMWAVAFALLYSLLAFVNRVSGVIAKIAAFGVASLLFGTAVFGVEAIGRGCTRTVSPLRLGSLPECFGIAAFANEGLLALASPIYAEARPTTQRYYFFHALGTIFFTLLLNASVGYIGLLCSPPDEHPDLITNQLHLNDPLAALALILIMLHVACTFPQVAFVLLQIVNEWTCALLSYACGGRNHASLRQRTCLLSIRVAVVLMLCAAGGIIANVGALLALFGGLANAAVTFILPIVFHMSLFRSKIQWWSIATLLQVLIILAATVAGSLATYSAARDLLSSF